MILTPRKSYLTILFSLLVLCIAVLSFGMIAAQDTDGLPAGFELATPVEMPETTDITIYVDRDNPNASDVGAGTIDVPKLTIDVALRDAVDNRRNGLSTRILIAPGVYREELRYNGEREPRPGAPIIIEAIEPGTVTLSAAEIYDDWTRADDNEPIYIHEWRYDWGAMGNPWGENNANAYMAPIVRRREAVFIDKQPLRQVLTRGELAPGTFLVSEANDELVIWLEDDINLGAAQVDVPVREVSVYLENVDNMAFRGLNFEYAAAKTDGAPLVIRNSDGILIEDSQFVWSNWAGFDIRRSQNITVLNSDANYNGVRGMGVFNVQNVYIENVDNLYNNWRGAMGGFNGWDAGQKFLLVHRGVFRNFRAEHNEGAGLWLDFDMQHILVEDSTICDNYPIGLFIEASPGPIVVRNNTICNNRAQARNFGNGGIFATNSEQVLLENNRIFGNDAYQVRLFESRRFREVGDTITGEIRELELTGWTIRDNLIVTTRPTQKLIEMPGRDDYEGVFTFSGNRYYDTQDEDVFMIGNSSLTFGQWLDVVADDATAAEFGVDDADILAALELTAETGVQGYYYASFDFSDLAYIRIDDNVNFDWFNSGPPELADDGYGVVWEGSLVPVESGIHEIVLRSTDPMRLYVDGRLAAEQAQLSEDDVEAIYVTELVAGEPVDIRVEYFDTEGVAHVILLWSYGSQPRQVIPPRQFSLAGTLPE